MKKMKLSLASLMIKGNYYKRKRKNIKKVLSFEIYIIVFHIIGKALENEENGLQELT